MANSSTMSLDVLKASSVQVIAKGMVGNSIVTILGAIGFVMSVCQLVVVYFWKPLRDMHQTLVVNAALADALKSASFGLICAKRVVSAAVGLDEVLTQKECMYWILPVAFTTFYGHSSIFVLSLERLAVVGVPIWYRNSKRKFLRALSTVSVLVSAVSSTFLFVGVPDDVLLPSCNLLSSTTAMFYSLLLYFQDAVTAGIILVNCSTGYLLVRRWRAAVVAKADMNSFKKEIQLNAVKAVFGVVIVCLLSFFAAMIFMALIQNLNSVTRAYYGPFWGCFQMTRAVVDFSLWLLYSKTYRTGFRRVVMERNCTKITEVQVISMPHRSLYNHTGV